MCSSHRGQVAKTGEERQRLRMAKDVVIRSQASPTGGPGKCTDAWLVIAGPAERSKVTGS